MDAGVVRLAATKRINKTCSNWKASYHSRHLFHVVPVFGAPYNSGGEKQTVSLHPIDSRGLFKHFHSTACSHNATTFGLQLAFLTTP